MTLPFAGDGGLGAGEPPALTPPPRKAPEPTLAQITKAMDFLSKALEHGPRLVREVEAEAKQQGHAKRTLARARHALHVKKLPPDEFRGPWRMALQGDQAVAAYQQHKDAKNQYARERQGNGRKRKRNESGRKQGDVWLELTTRQ